MSHFTALSRRQFVKTFLVTTAGSTLAGLDWQGLFVAELAAAPPGANGSLRVSTSDIAALRNVNGSVRLGTSTIGSDNKPRGLFHPIIINRGQNNQFFALSAECTHEGCVVGRFSGGAMTCPCHLSRFAIDGRVLAGPGPARFPLTSYPLTFDGISNLDIELPDWVFIASGQIVQSGASLASRFRLEFLSFVDMTYEIRFRPSLDETWQIVSFSLTETGPANQLSLAGRDDNTVVYVDRTTDSGFYAVTLKVITV